VIANCVPVAVNVYERDDRYAPDKSATGKFFWKVYLASGLYQGVCVASPEGNVLASVYSSDAKKVRESVAAGVKAFGEVKPRTAAASRPHVGIGIQPDGAVTLALYNRRRSLSDSRTRYGCKYEDVTLSAKEWQTLAPDRLAAAVQWTVPQTVADKFRSVVIDYNGPNGPTLETTVQITGRVQAVDNDVAYLAYEGRISRAADKDYRGVDMKLVGAGAYDGKARQMLSLTWVLDGTSHHPAGLDPGLPLGGIVEWRRERGK
jgi:hypothetical protein